MTAAELIHHEKRCAQLGLDAYCAYLQAGEYKRLGERFAGLARSSADPIVRVAAAELVRWMKQEQLEAEARVDKANAERLALTTAWNQRPDTATMRQR